MIVILKLIVNDDDRGTNRYCSFYLVPIIRTVRNLIGHNLKIM